MGREKPCYALEAARYTDQSLVSARFSMEETTTSPTTVPRLPVPLSSFVGREAEIARVRDALASHRLVTLTGAGGSGKTRLAIEAARGLTASPDGEWFAGLAAVSNPELVLQTVGEVVGVREAPSGSLLDALIERLSQKQMLIVLDNCEHVIDASAELVDQLLRVCPGVRVLATSRERLRVEGETVFALASLSSPTQEQSTEPGDVAQFEAVQLFVERARSMQPAFELSGARAPLVASICRRLDGMPLAIELAAARLGTLSLQEIDRRLAESLAVLSGGSRTSPRRQQTLSAAIEWSYELLNDAERALFRRLAVFQGGWMLDAAEGVCGGDGVASEDVADLLGGLVEKSLALGVEQANGELRYRLLEPLRQFGQEKLAAAGEVGDLLDRHAKWFGRLAEANEGSVFSSDQVAVFDRFALEMNNLRGALARSMERPKCLDAGIRIVWVLTPFWKMRESYAEGYRWASQVYAAAKAAGHPKAYTLLVRMALLSTRSDKSIEALEVAAEAARAAEDEPSLCTALALLCLQYYLEARLDDAIVVGEEAVSLARGLESDLSLCRTLGFLAVAHVARDGFAEGRPIFEEAIRAGRAQGDRLALMAVLNNIADAERGTGLFEAAKGHYEESRALLSEIGGDLSLNTLNLGLLAMEMGDPGRALPMLRQVLESVVDGGAAVRAFSLLGIASVAEPLTAATLLGAGYASLARLGVKTEPNDAGMWERIEGATREQLSPEEFAEAYAAGQVMPTEEAIELGLSVRGPGAERAPGTGRQPSNRDAAAAPGLELTARELETLRLLASGLTNKEIAAEMVVSVRTVENHVANLYGKIGARGRADATAFALSHGVVESHS
jgi:predicted ATPase/DNA-binding CsgD family transcriptional regulator